MSNFTYDNIPEPDSKRRITQFKADTESEKDKVVCVNCTDSFFKLFFKEQVQDQYDDEIMGDIYNKKVYMKWIPDQLIFQCSCGEKYIPQETLISSPKKVLKVAGIDNDMRNNTGFTKAVTKKVRDIEYMSDLTED